MKKKNWIIIIGILIVGFLFFISFNQDKEDLNVVWNEVNEYEYGSELYIHDLIKETNGEYDDQQLDTLKIGQQTVNINLSKEEKKMIFTSTISMTYNKDIVVVDTVYPTITLTKDKVVIKAGQKINVLDYIKEVKDEVDGQLKYNEEKQAGSYSYEGKVDYNKAGEYKIIFIASDLNNNQSKKELKIIVEEENTDESSNDFDSSIMINKDKVIVINAGHQAKGNSSKERNSPNTSVMKAKVTTGATGKYSKQKESQINLDISKKLKTELESRGYTVIMTRTTQNVNISNKERAMIGNKNKAGAVIHIHCDDIDDSSVHGAHTISISKNNPAYPGLYKASSKLAKSVIDSYCKATGMKNRGAKTSDDLTGLNWSQVPAIYIECGFLSNKNDDLNLADSDFQKKCAKGIADGIDQYFG